MRSEDPEARPLARRLAAWTMAAAALGGSACANASVTSPTAAVYNRPLAVEVFSGTLPLLGSQFYSFSVPQSGPASIVLLGLKEDGVDSTATMQIAIGVPRGIDCLAVTSVTVGVGTNPQIAISADPAIYCARIVDVGNLKAPGDFAINISRPR